MYYTSSPPIISECKDLSERIDLFESHGLFIKPIARLNITIQLAPAKNPGQTVPYAEIIDKLKKQVAPDDFIYIRMIKSTLEFIRCEAEIENKSALKNLLTKLDGSSIKINSYTDVLKVRAAESKIAYPIRHDWESFFKDSTNPTVELKPGERADTVHLNDIPVKWFSDRKLYAQCGDSLAKPSEATIREVFSIFGEIRMIDVPILTNSLGTAPTATGGMKKQPSSVDLTAPSNLNLNTFEAFIQYKDSISFVKAMDTFRGMKLLYVDPESSEAFTANIRVDFDRTRHLSDREIKKREIDKLKQIELDKIKNAQMEKEKEKEAKQKEIANFRAMLEESALDSENKKADSDEKSKEQRRREREEARRQKRLAQKQHEEEKKLEQKIALEERKILIAQRKLESMRLLEELFNRVKLAVAQEELEKRQKQLKAEKAKRDIEEANLEQAKKLKIEQDELELKEKIQKNIERRLQEEAMLLQKAEEAGFELRKNLPTTEGDTESNPGDASTSGTAQIAMPRSLLLSNTPQVQSQPQHQHQTKPQLYDDEDEVKNASPQVNSVQSEISNKNDENSNSNFAPEQTTMTPSVTQSVDNNMSRDDDDDSNANDENEHESSKDQSNNNSHTTSESNTTGNLTNEDNKSDDFQATDSLQS